MTPPTSKFLKGHQSRATDDDRAWFLAHPTEAWRLREAFPGEEEALARDPLRHEPTHYAAMTTHLLALAQHPDAAPVTELVLCVLAIDPSTRLRVPALRDARSGKFWLVDEEGAIVTPAALAARFREGLALQGLGECDLGDACPRCGRPEQSGDLSVVFEGEGASTEAEVCCLACAVPVLRQGRVATGLALYMRKDEAPRGPVMTAAIRDLKRLQAAQPSPSALADAIVALVTERSRA
jgi:hypothetical protein